MKHTGKWLILVLLLLIMQGSQAQTGPGIKIKRVLNGANGQLAKDSAMTVLDSIYFDGALAGKLDTPYQVRNIITFSINEYSKVYLSAAFSATANVRIYYTKRDNTPDSADQSLTINYDTANTYTMRSSFVFKNAHQVKVKVLSITAPSNVLPVLLLENEMEVHPVYKLACVENAVKYITSNNPLNTDSTDEISVSWPVTTGADEYDLEWAYIDSSALQEGRFSDSSQIFAFNTTRVTITNNTYAIPLLYDDNGILFYRVRAVQKKSSINRIETSWSTIGKYKFVGHARNLNWQSSITFAEEGKRKVVVQYFDGSLRNRQTVTKDNITNTTVVSEQFYDYQGRPAISILPAPTLNNIIKYSHNLNAAVNGAEYDKDNYDLLPSPAQYLSASAKPMSTASGTNQYYSANNPEKNTGVNKYIPDAGGYAFSETEYTQDNTGRIRRQGGVGETFKLGSGHETKYYYATPVQEDLDALFGTEVGDHTHYFKNMTSDGNGQYAVAYLDMHGRTIATALAGSAETGNLDDLASKEVVTVTDSLSGPGTNIVKDLTMSNQHSHLVTQDGNVSFKYLLTPPVLKRKDCDNNNICYNGLYDLKIRITDDCYNQHLGGKPFDTILHNYNAGAIIANCNAPVPIEVGFSLYLLKGSYEITKTLTISKQGMDYYRDSVFLKNNVCKSLDEFVEEQKILQRDKVCVPDCKSCLDSIDSWDSFRVKYVTAAGNSISDTALYRGQAWTAYQSALTACNELCGTVTEGDDMRSLMLLDVSGPSGQYAIESDSSSIYSIFYEKDENTLAPYQRDSVIYLDEEGKPDLVYDEYTNSYVKPQALRPGQFADKFKTSWAPALLKFHPEYCKLIESDRHAASYTWDIAFEEVDSYAAARDAGYLNPTANPNIPFPGINTDPLSLENVTLKNKLNAKLNNYSGNYSMWTIATSAAKCCPATYSTPALAFNEATLCSGDLDMAWRNFRQLYLNAKRDVISELLINTTCAGVTKVTTEALVTAGKQVRFTNAKAALEQGGYGYLNNGNLNQATVQDSANKIQERMYDQNCRAYVSTWMLQLAPCKYSAAALEELTTKMIAVCKAGSDMEHSRGSSTVKPGSNNPYSSFEMILNDYNTQHNIQNPLVCNAQLVTVPQPYEKQTAYSNIASYARPDDCQCDKLHTLQREYNAVKKATDINFSVYLKRTRGITVTQSDLDVLLDACTIPASSGCSWLSKPISIPPVMQCAVAPSCINCTEMTNQYNTYRSLYINSLPLLTVDDSLQLKKNKLFTDYMNNHLGFNLATWQYLAFMDSCKLPKENGTLVCKPASPNAPKMVSSYSNGGTDYIADILHTKEKGYVMAGSTTGSGAGEKDAYIIKTDSSGNLLWSKTYGGELADEFVRCKPTKDSGYIAIGNTFSYCYDRGAILIVKLDKDGNVQWNQTIDPGYPSVYGGRGNDIIETSEGNYAFTGTRMTGEAVTDLVTGVLTGSGELGWMKQRTITGTGFRDKTSLLEVDNTLMIAAALLQSGISSAAVFMIDKFTGSLMDDARYSIDNRSSVTASPVIYKTPGGYKLGLATLQKGVLVDLDPNGQVLAAKRIALPTTLTGSTFVTSPSPDGGVIATEHSASDVYLHKISVDNNPQWTSHVKIDGTDHLNRILQNPDGTFTGAGNFNNTAMLMRATATGKTGCRDSLETVTVTDIMKTTSRLPGLPESQLVVTMGYNEMSTVPLLELLTTPSSTVISCPGDSCYLAGDGPLLCGNAEPVFNEEDGNDISNCTDSTFFAVSAGTVLYNAYLDSIRNSFNEDYIRTGLQAASLEKFAITYSSSEYHYTLYYYDQAGNLVKTVPPAGVMKNRSTAWTNSVKLAKAAGTTLVPPHKMATEYRYNSLNELIAQKTPDAGKSRIWYDRLGRLAVSQNAKQAAANKYSYIVYDELGRTAEGGELTNTIPMTDSISRKPLVLASWINAVADSRKEIVRTIYDLPIAPFEGELWNATNLRNRVSWSAIYNDAPELTQGKYASATFYSYDIHGGINLLMQDYKLGGMADAGMSNRWKKMAYTYDVISRKVNTVSYQAGKPDAFYHRYSYDAENRVTNVETSRDSVYWENEAYYQYYKHGPLARTVIGQQQVQGLDYAYTMEGWLKGVNSTSLTPANDPGHDGAAGSMVAKDILGFALHFYGNDYSSVNKTVQPFAGGTTFSPLYNGNIAAVSEHLPSVGTPLSFSYKYDQLNRLIGMQASKGLNPATNTWTPVTLPDFQEKISYDANGNILTYKRNGNSSTSLPMDSLSYRYKTGTNQLDFIEEGVHATNYNNDIDNQLAGNYNYDAVGNLVKDSAEKISSISWNAYGKIAGIRKTDSTVISYSYDAGGNRVSKTVNGVQTWYVRDGSGHVMSVYVKNNPSVNNGALTQSETHLYGSSRLGINTLATNVQIDSTAPTTPLTGLGAGFKINFIRGKKFFELGNHLGNVLATVSDRKKSIFSGNLFDHYEADIVSAQDYYPFGMQMPGRTFNSNKYRYGFNGMENDNEVKGTANQLDFGMRVYDPRVGKFLSIDPLTGKFPWQSGYASMDNNPVFKNDPTGMEATPPSTGVRREKDGSYTVVSAKNDGDRNVYVVDENGKYDKTSEVIATTLRPYDFMMTDDKAGTLESDPNFKGRGPVNFRMDNLELKFSHNFFYPYTETAITTIPDLGALMDFADNLFDQEKFRESFRGMDFYQKLTLLKNMSGNFNPQHRMPNGALDFKASLGLHMYTPVRVGGEGSTVITPLRAASNIVFGNNMAGTRPIFTLITGATWFYEKVMPKVGGYNQSQNGGNGYNPGFPYYGEHTYSGSYIYYGFFGEFYK